MVSQEMGSGLGMPMESRKAAICSGVMDCTTSNKPWGLIVSVNRAYGTALTGMMADVCEPSGKKNSEMT